MVYSKIVKQKDILMSYFDVSSWVGVAGVERQPQCRHKGCNPLARYQVEAGLERRRLAAPH